MSTRQGDTRLLAEPCEETGEASPTLRERCRVSFVASGREENSRLFVPVSTSSVFAISTVYADQQRSFTLSW